MMKNAILNELIKFSKRKKFITIAVFSLLALTLITLLEYKESDELLSSTKIPIEEILEMEHAQLEAMSENEKVDKKFIEKSEQVLDLTVEKELPFYGNLNAPTFLLDEIQSGIFVGLILPFIIIILAIDLIVGEYNSSNLKLLLFSPLERNKIILAKLLASLIVIVVTALIYYLIQYLIHGIMFGFSGWTDQIILTFSTPKVYLVYQGVLMSFLLLLITILFYLALALFFSVIFKNTVNAVLAFVISWVLQLSAPSYLEKLAYSHYLVFPNVNLAKFLSLDVATQIYGLSFNVAMSLVCLTTFLLIYLSMLVFSKKDMYI